jgi:hypothetical protein
VKFNLGDRVKMVENYLPYDDDDLKVGMTGVIVDTPHSGVFVIINETNLRYWFDEEELELDNGN